MIWKGKLCKSDNLQKSGEYYNEELLDFIYKYFDPERARKNSQSLDRFLNKLVKWR